MSTPNGRTSYPQSMRHKQILDAAEEHPDASIQEIASMVPSATVDLVERVFEKHGDPAADEGSADQTPEQRDDTDESVPADQTRADDDVTVDDAGPSGEAEPSEKTPDAEADHDGKDTPSASTTAEPDTEATKQIPEEEPVEQPLLESLSEKQHEVLSIVAERPNATQQEIGEELDVSSPTVSNRVNSIEGFDWSERQSFVEELFDTETTQTTPDGGQTDESSATESTTVEAPAGSTDSVAIEEELAAIDDRLAVLERALDTERENETSVFADPELVHKIAHACLESAAISEAEELRILEELLS